jgi:glutaredoxin
MQTVISRIACVDITYMEGKEPGMSPETEVKLYTLSTCSHCKAAKKFLNDCNVSYDFVDVDMLRGSERLAVLEQVRNVNPLFSFPTILIGDRVIAGFDEHKIREALGL